MKKNYLAFAAILYMPLHTQAQENDKPDSTKSVKLNEVVISVNKQKENKTSVAQDVLVIDKKELETSQAKTTADVLSNAGLHVQRSQLGGGSPVLRGFEASRILLVVDGIRMNNLIYRAGHLQNIVTTDNNSFERIEVLYGPASTIYGSDAMGGAIHMFTKSVQLSPGGKMNFKLNVLSRYESASTGLTEHVDMNVGGKKFGSFTSFTYSKHGDLMGGTNQNPFYTGPYGERTYYAAYLGNGKDTAIKNPNRYLQVGSAYTQYDLVQKFLFKQNDIVLHGLNLQLSNSGEVPRYDRLTDPHPSKILNAGEWYYGPQTRLLAAYDLNIRKPGGTFDLVHVGVNYQALEESRHNRNFNSSFRNSRIEQVGVIGANLDFQKTVKAHTVRFGLDAQLNALKSTAYRTNIVVDTTGELDTRYPDGENSMNYYALYFSHSWKITDQFSLVDGFRAGYTTLRSTLVDTALLFHLPYTDIEQNTPVWSGNIGFIHSPDEDMKVSILLSTSYRVPNVDDMSKIFGSSAGMVIVPNPSLRPERTINYELGVTRLVSSNTRWENTIYYTDYRDIAVVDKYTLNGQDSILYDGVMSKVYANQNKGLAFIYGFTSNLISQLDDHFRMTASVNYTYGRLKTDSTDVPLDHIPPFLARLGFTYTHKQFRGDFFAIYNSAKKLNDYSGSGEDNLQYATPVGMPAWFTLNIRASYQLHKYVSLQAGVDNIFDTQYRTFASGINAPGRNFIVALRGNF
ncbi:MAG TPA: TonB-dependent receptor [Flavobacteriales bacterium]|nr:TonB-dependent receptor [Flavobacteriales bacterium]